VQKKQFAEIHSTIYGGFCKMAKLTFASKKREGETTSVASPSNLLRDSQLYSADLFISQSHLLL
jgi:hypothetical protein